MRDSCIQCVAKHLGDAEIYLREFHTGYTSALVRGLAELDHAYMEAVQKWPELAAEIHGERKNIETNPEGYTDGVSRLVDRVGEMWAEYRTREFAAIVDADTTAPELESIRVIITARGGITTGVFSSDPRLDVALLDYDEKEAAEKDEGPPAAGDVATYAALDKEVDTLYTVWPVHNMEDGASSHGG